MHAYLRKADVQPFYALSWLITWFSHNLTGLAQTARLFDLFLATHPLMPLYFACVVIRVRALLFARAVPIQSRVSLSHATP